MSYLIPFQWIPSLGNHLFLFFAHKTWLYSPTLLKLLPTSHPPTISRSHGLVTNLESMDQMKFQGLLDMKRRQRGWPVTKCKNTTIRTEAKQRGVFTRICFYYHSLWYLKQAWFQSKITGKYLMQVDCWRIARWHRINGQYPLTNACL